MTVIENFDNLTNGDLNGQNSWSGSTYYVVQDTVYQAGSKACKFYSDGDNTYYSIKKSFTSQTAAIFTFYVRKDANNNGYTQVKLLDNTTLAFRIQFTDGAALQFIGGSIRSLGSYNTATFYKFDIEIRSSDGYGRGRVNEGTWSDWTAPSNAYSTINAIDFACRDGGVSQVSYFDELSYAPAVVIKTFSETFGITETNKKSLIRVYIETFNLIENLTEYKKKVFTFIENLGISEITSRKFTKSLTEVFSMTETFIKKVSKNLIENFNLTVALVSDLSKVFKENFSISDTIKIYLNGISTIWRKSTKPSSSWNKESKPSSSWTNSTKTSTVLTNEDNPNK